VSGQTQKRPRASFTGLLLFSGVDRSGIAAGIFSALSPFSVKIIDLEQILIGDRTIFAILIELDPAHVDVIEKELSTAAASLDLDFAAQFTDQINNPSKLATAKVIIVGENFKPAILFKVATAITSFGANIGRMVRIAAAPVLALEFLISISGSELENLRKALVLVSKSDNAAISLIESGAASGSRKLIIFDVDSTLIQEEVIDLLAARANVSEEVSTITAAAMRGEIDFTSSLAKRVSLLTGLSADDLITVRSEIHLSDGATNLIKFLQSQGHIVAAVSGGFVEVLEPLMAEIGITNYHANKLEIIDGKLTGKIIGAIVDSKTKSETLVKFANQFKILMTETVAIGDGANDMEMLQSAGVGIAFNAKPKLKEIADIVLDIPNLDAVIYLLGMSNLDVTSN
jgi:phosphoserine phosphatase